VFAGTKSNSSPGRLWRRLQRVNFQLDKQAGMLAVLFSTPQNKNLSIMFLKIQRNGTNTLFSPLTGTNKALTGGRAKNLGDFYHENTKIYPPLEGTRKVKEKICRE
jgi:hypothetical protein